MNRTGKYSLHALIDEIREEEDKQAEAAKKAPDPIGKNFAAGVSVGLGIAADIVEGFMFRQREDRLKKEGRL